MSNLASAYHERWSAIAQFWDQQTQNGSFFHRDLVAPMARRLLGPVTGKRILDVGCSSGLFARELATEAGHVVGFDFVEAFVQMARRRAQDAPNTEFHTLDATLPTTYESLGPGKFDRAIALMSLMDIPHLQPVYAGMHRSLVPGGAVVAVLLHPCFNSRSFELFQESHGARGLKVQRYMTPESFDYIGFPGQPQPHLIFHRPLHELLGPAFSEGFVLEALEEGRFPEPPGPAHWSMRNNFPEIPSVLGVRLRKL